MTELKFNHTAHRRLWYWVANLRSNPEGFVDGSLNAFWLQANGYGELKNDCFACQYALEKTKDDSCICVNCPLDWGEHKFCLHPDGDTLYTKRELTKAFTRRWRGLSWIIATLPVKEGVEVIQCTSS